VRETYDWTIKAFNYAEKFRVPVIVLIDEIIAHINEKIVIPQIKEIEILDRKRTKESPETYMPYKFTESLIPPIADFGSGYRFNVTGLSHDETGFPTNDPVKIDSLYRRLNRKINRYKDEIIEFKKVHLDDAEICVVAYGSTARSARRAIQKARDVGIKIGLFQPYVLWPFPYEELAKISQNIKSFIVPEMNLGQIAHEVSCATNCEVVRVNRVDGGLITPGEILETLKNVSI